MMRFRMIGVVLWGVFGIAVSTSVADDWNVEKDIVFATFGESTLAFDLYTPTGKTRDGVIVWIHGGAWRSGSKEKVPVLDLMKQGWALASVDYRLSRTARFPAQIHDIKAAIRYLRAHQDRLSLKAERVFIVGASAGGHLAALAGVTNGHPELEGTVGEHLDASSDIQGVISLFGASNLTTILDQSTPHGLSVRVPALDLFIGGHPDDVTEVARLASPVFHVDQDDPPLLMIHGDQDPQMPINQSIELLGKYESLGLEVDFAPLYGGKHGGAPFYDETRMERMLKFLSAVR